MIDESMDTEFLNRAPEPWEFRARPMWARMIVISAGVMMNVLLALAIFTSLHYVRGRDTMETTEVGYVAEKSPAARAGLLAGDRIRTVNNKPIEHWDQIQSLIYIDYLGDDISLEVERDGRGHTVFIPRKEIPGISEDQLGMFIAHTVSIVSAVEFGMPAEKLGLKPGDTLVAISEAPIRNRQQVVSAIKSHAGNAVTIQWKRGTELMSGTTSVTGEGRIGISIGTLYTGPMQHLRYSLLEAIPQGIGEIGQSVSLFYLTITKIFRGKASVRESFGGPIAIAQLATQSAEYGFLPFIWFMAQLSMSLAILNILPIPALDGGHLIMLLYEKIFRREIPHRVKIAIQQAGFILLLAFMAFVIYNDISKF